MTFDRSEVVLDFGNDLLKVLIFLLEPELVSDYLIGFVGVVKALLNGQKVSEVSGKLFCFFTVLQRDPSIFLGKMILTSHEPLQLNLSNEESVVRESGYSGFELPVSWSGHRPDPVHLRFS